MYNAQQNKFTLNPESPAEWTAESILARLRELLLNVAQSRRHNNNSLLVDPHDVESELMTEVERTYGPAASKYGRILSDLLLGSSAWEYFHEQASQPSRYPPNYVVSQCEPVMKIMRQTGELADRETLLRERDTRYIKIWRDPMLNEERRRMALLGLQDEYELTVMRLAETYKRQYHDIKHPTIADIAPLLGARRRTWLQPPLMAFLYRICHGDKDSLFDVTDTADRVGLTCRDRNHAVTLSMEKSRALSPAAPRDEIRNPQSYAFAVGRGPDLRVSSQQPDICALPEGIDQQGERSSRAVKPADLVPFRREIEKLDEMTWDIIAVAVSMFFARTPGNNCNVAYPLMIDDYFQWRGSDPRKRTSELRDMVDERIRLLCSNSLEFHCESQLFLSDAATGRRKRTEIITDGPLLTIQSHITRRSVQSTVPPTPARRSGYMILLGEWARKYVEQRAMLGICLKQLAEYDLRREQWERRIGWYLVFQMNNQATKMKFDEVVKGGKSRTVITPQHSLRMKTVLNNSLVAWSEMAKTNPGKVIRQWVQALERLRADGIIGNVSCLDGTVDGSDLPERGRLTAMLDRRYQFLPGVEMLRHLRAKKAAATRKRKPQEGG